MYHRAVTMHTDSLTQIMLNLLDEYYKGWHEGESIRDKIDLRALEMGIQDAIGCEVDSIVKLTLDYIYDENEAIRRT